MPAKARRRRNRLSEHVRIQILTEAGYRCVPTCRTLFVLDLHHIDQISDGGGNEPSNLIALCPTCHRMFHARAIPVEAIRTYKGMLTALNHAFDADAVDMLLFVDQHGEAVQLSGDGLLRFARLISTGLVAMTITFRGAMFGAPAA